MAIEALWILTVAVFAVAVLYSSVGHAGASGYIAVMTLIGLAPADIKPIALTLNILVASIGTFQFWRAGHFSWPLFWPFALLSVPCAFIGGYLDLPTHAFKMLVGIVLIVSAVQFLVRPPDEGEPRQPPRLVTLGAGGLLGLLSGLTGTGGGIFLTPLLIFMRWARTKNAAAVSAPFILLNSASGLAGNLSATRSFPAFAWALVAAVVIGGTIGSWFGSRRLPHTAIKRLLSVVLTIAGFKLVFT
ncbi:MAG: sulfite exporter TauE/SafE family protein [Gammaproteobacteria bacterium]|nr:sulfite exporter TauE/SafE family protein [Gammaproteobacteria bacterium]